jgi:hypothetical protein
MSLTKKIDLAAIDRTTFNVKERDGRFLITPTKGKHVWTEDELKLRSLLTDAEGNVLSSGFEKFRNYGEDPIDDEAFRLALGRKAVTFTEKMDGSLIIMDWIDGKVHFRTRGSFDLGTFGPPVMALIEEKYPNLIPWFRTDNFLGDIIRREYSLLFEYTAPTNRIVIRYDDAGLTLLGKANKRTLEPVLDHTMLSMVSGFTGVPLVKTHELPFDMDSLGPIVRAWGDKEGVVAQFVATGDGIFNKPRRVKIKASQYVKLHALKFKLEGNVGKLLFLLGARNTDEARTKLHDLGVDFEAAEFVRDEMNAYIKKLYRVEEQFYCLEETLAGRIEVAAGRKEYRKAFVEFVDWLVEENGWGQSFFGAAMKLYDGKDSEAWIQVAATELMGESPTVVKNWLTNPNVAVADLLNVKVDED